MVEDPGELTDDVLVAPLGGEDSVVVIEQGGVVILDGPAELVAELVASDPTLRQAAPLSVSGGAAAGALAQITNLVSNGDTQQLLFQLDEKGIQMFQQGTLAPTDGGWMRAFGRAADGTISGHAAIKPLLLAPQQILTAQLAITTVALTAAIRQVQEAVERVEHKVDVLKDLVQAELVGAILGAHRSLHRRAEQLDFTGVMSDTDWNAIDSLGVQVEQQIEVLRSFVRKRLQAAHDEGMRIADRRDAISYIDDLSETLKLLVVAQDSLFLFQQLRLIRIRDREPELLEAAILEAKDLLADQKREDLELLGSVHGIVSARVEVQALEIHRFMSARAVIATAGSVDGSLASFSAQRTLSYEPIRIPPVPPVAAAIEELRGRSSSIAGDAKNLTTSLVRRVRDSDKNALPADAPVAELGEGAVTPDTSENEGEVGSAVASVGNSIRSVRDRAISRFRTRKGADDQAEATDELDPPTSELKG